VGNIENCDGAKVGREGSGGNSIPGAYDKKNWGGRQIRAEEVYLSLATKGNGKKGVIDDGGEEGKEFRMRKGRLPGHWERMVK